MLRASAQQLPSLPPSPRSPGRFLNKKTAQILGILLFLLGIGLIILWNLFHDWNTVALPDEHIGLQVLDRFDRPVCTLLQNKEFSPVPLGKMSKYLQQAIVAAEDHGFYHHSGISLESILRAEFANLRAGHVVQGGSTITQQLVKNLYFSDDKRTFLAKLKEAVMAVELNQRYSKDQILEAYLNYVYFGRGSFGVEQGAQKYFGRHASQLDLAQSAYLAGLVNAPSRLSTHVGDAQTREREILDEMVQQNFVLPKAAEEAKNEKLIFKGSITQQERYGYYLSYVVSLLQSQFPQDRISNDGLKVYTNLDPAAQALADRTLTQRIKTAPNGISQGALVSISVKDGAVVAMVGGVGSFEQSPWNRAVSPHTAGSAFKPFVYLTGLITGALKPDSAIDDAPLTIKIPGTSQIYAPKNFEGDYMGVITIRKALALSRNTCAVRVAQAVGPQAIVDTASRAGVTSKLDPTLALALGASAVSPLDMANSYATLARGGVRITPTFIRRVEDREGHLLASYPAKQERVFEAEPVAELVDALEDVVAKGTGTRARLLGRPVAGKTGTADGAKDIWFIGFTPDLVTAVWGGNDKNQAVHGKQVTGGSIMAGIWQQYMLAYYNSHPTPAGTFLAAQTPLAQEAEEIHFLPQPAGIFDKIDHFLDPGDYPQPAPAYSAGNAPAVAPERVHFGTVPPKSGHAGSESPPRHKGPVKRFFKHLFGL